jgi:hypothetical protein
LLRYVVCLLALSMAMGTAGAQQRPPDPPKSIAVDPKVFDRYVGYYQADLKTNPDQVVEISRGESRFMIQAAGQPKFELTPVTERQFSFYMRDAQAFVVVTFVAEGDGKVNQLIYRQLEGDTIMKRVDVRTAMDTTDRAILNAWFGANASQGLAAEPGVPALPQWELVPRTAASIPLGTAMPPNAPASINTIPLDKHGYVEEEYFFSGTGNIYAPGGRTVWKGNMPYTTRMLVRRPADLKTFSGTIHIEPTRDGTEWASTLMDAWPYFVKNGDVFVAWSTSRGDVTAMLQKFDPVRYAAITIPANGLRWDIMAQAAWLLRSPDGPLGKLGFIAAAAQKQAGLRLYSTGTASTAEMQGFFINDGHHARAHTPQYEPVIDAYFPIMNTQRIKPQDDAYVMRVISEFEYANPGTNATPGAWLSRITFGRARAQIREYHLAGTGHRDRTQHAQNAVTAFQLGLGDDLTPRCVHAPTDTPGKAPTIRALFAALDVWVREGKTPPPSRMFRLAEDHLPVRDDAGNVIGAVRPSWIGVPTSRFMVDNEPADKNSPISNVVCRLYGYEVPFPADRLAALYKDRADYVAQVNDYIDRMIQQRYLLPEDAEAERKRAAATKIPD